MALFFAAAVARADGEDKKFATSKDFSDAIALDGRVEDFLLMDVADLLDNQWCFPRLRGVFFQNKKLIIRCRMGGGNRECCCYVLGYYDDSDDDNDDDDTKKCEACTARTLCRHPLFISDEDEDYDITYNRITFGPVDGLSTVPSLDPFKVVLNGKRAFKCPKCAEVMNDSLLPYPYAHCQEIVAWLKKHSECLSDDASAATD